MPKISLNGLPNLKINPYINKNQTEETITVLKNERQEEAIKVIESELVIPKITIPKKIKMANFSYYGKQENINKVKKLAKHYGVTPSALIDSILDAYFNSDAAKSGREEG